MPLNPHAARSAVGRPIPISDQDRLPCGSPQLRESRASYGIARIERCLTDNGSCYRSRKWAAALAATVTTHKRTRPYMPRTNGKVERYNGTLVREWLRRRPYDSEEDRTAALAEFLNYYNHERKHSALDWLPPVARTPAKGRFVIPEPIDDAVEITEAQMSIFDLSGSSRVNNVMNYYS